MIKKMWSMCVMEYYSAIKKNESDQFVVVQVNLESVTQSEVQSDRKPISFINTYIWSLEKWYR